MKRAYLLLCILGTVLPRYFFFSWVAKYGFSMQAILTDISTSKVIQFILADFGVTALSFFVLLFSEGRKAKDEAALAFCGGHLFGRGIFGVSPILAHAGDAYRKGDRYLIGCFK